MIIVDLFKFEQETNSWFYTSSKRSYLFESNSYLPVPIGRSDLQSSSEFSKNSMMVTVDFKTELAQNLLLNVSEKSTNLTVFRSINGTTSMSFKGRLAGIQPSNNSLQLSFVNVNALLKRQGLRRIASRTCPFALYGIQCSADPSNFETEGFVNAINGNVLSIPIFGGFPNGYFDAGFISFGSQRRMIRLHQGNSITISRGFEGLVLGSAVKLHPGCDHLLKTCTDKFSNQMNFGGLPFMSTDNPFSSSDAL